MILRLNLKRQWWEQIRDGKKDNELRLATEYWRQRLLCRDYTEVHLCLGYPKRGDCTRILCRKWLGVYRDTVVHPEFGSAPVDVFIIKLGLLQKEEKE